MEDLDDYLYPMVLFAKNSKKYNDQKKRNKGKNNDLQNIAQKTKYWATQTPLTSGGELLKCSWRVKLGKGYEITMNTRENHIKYKDYKNDWCATSGQLLNLIKSRTLPCSPLLICYRVKDLRKSHYRSHMSDPMYHPMKMVIVRLIKCY